MKKIQRIIFCCLLLFLCKRNVFAYDKYHLEDFIFFDPVSNEPCSEKNYWTYYNQKRQSNPNEDNTCYRFLVFTNNDTENKSTIKLLLDHNLAVTSFNKKQEVLNQTKLAWSRYSGEVRSPHENDVVDLMQLSETPVINSGGVPTVVYHIKGTNKINLPTMYTNIDYIVAGQRYESNGYWLDGDYTDSSYAYSIAKHGGNTLSKKTDSLGVRPIIEVDKSLISKLTITAITDYVNNEEKTEKYQYGKVCSEYNRLQGFTVADVGLIFYASSTSRNDGLLVNYAHGSNFSYSSLRSVYEVNSGHGNGITYIPNDNDTSKRKIMVAGPSNYYEIHEYYTSNIRSNSSYNCSSMPSLSNDKTYSFNDSYNTIGYDRKEQMPIVQAHKRFYFIGRASDDDGDDIDIKHDFNNLLYSVDLTHLKIVQDAEYFNGYIYAAAYENLQSNYQLYNINNDSDAKIYVINAKFKDDGTPDKDFGKVAKVFYIRDSVIKAGEIEGISFYGGTVWLGYSVHERYPDSPFRFYKIKDISDSENFIVAPNVEVSYDETDTSTKITITSTSQLKGISGWSLSNDKYTLSKTVSNQTAASEISVCDRYNNCGTVSIKAITKKTQTVSFSSSSVEKQFHLGSYTLAATSTGDGAITYTSSDTSVATVNNNGKVTFKKVGQVIITATAAKTDNYYLGTGYYVLNITKGNQSLSFDSTQVNKTVTDSAFTIAANHPVGDGIVTYESSNTNVATVDNNGTVTIVGSGVTTITATAVETSNYKSITTSYTLNVSKNNQDLNFSTSTVNKKYGDSSFAMIANHPVGNGTVTYESSNTNVATVDNSGTVTIVGIGTTTITATAAETNNYFVASASYTLTVAKGSQELSFSVSDVYKRHGDAAFTIVADHPVGDGTVTYSSTNSNVATVDNTGKVTIRGLGTTTIKATAASTAHYNSASASYSLIVESKAVQELSFPVSTVNKKYGNSDFIVRATRMVGDGIITYSSSNTNVATVNNTGKVTIIGVGTTTITATVSETANYASASASYSLNVEKGSQELSFPVSTINKKLGDLIFIVSATHSVGDGIVTYSTSDPTVALVDNTGKVTIVGVGTTTITATASATSHYKASSASYSLNVEQKLVQELSFSSSVVNKEYGDSDYTMTATHTVGDGNVTYSSSNTSVATVDNTGKVTIVGVGTATITAAASETNDYSLTSASYSLNVSKGSQEISFPISTINKKYGDLFFTVSATHSVGDGTVTYTSSSPTVALVDNTGKVTIVGVGTATITATASATSHYKAASASYSLNVATKTAQEMSFPSSTVTKEYGDSSFTIGVVHSVGDGTVTYSSSDTSVATVTNDGTVTIVGVGTTNITATAAETNDYSSASASYSLNVSKGSQEISFSISTINKKVSDLFFTETAVHTVGDGTVTYSSSSPTVALVDNNGKVTIVGVGTATITATAAGTEHYKEASASYSLNVGTKNAQVLSFSSSVVNKEYGDSDYTMTATHTVGDGAVTYSSSDAQVATVNNSGKVHIVGVGTTTIMATAAETSNYAASSTSYSLNVSKGSQEISFLISTINKKYGDLFFIVSATHSVGDGTVTYTSSSPTVALVDNTGKVTIVGVGTATITATASETAHYKEESTSYSLNVGSKTAQMLSFPQSTVNKKYGDSDYTMAATHTVGDGVVTYSSSDAQVATVNNSGKVHIVGVGTVTIMATAAETSDYAASSTSYTLHVGKGTQSLEFAESTIHKRYGDSGYSMAAIHSVGDGEVTYSSSDTQVVVVDNSGTVTIVGVGTTTIMATAAETANYSALSVGYTLSVSKRAQEIRFSDSTVNKRYGDEDYVIAAIHSVGDGAVTYSSSDVHVAEVDDTGKVTIKNAGTAIITVSAAGTPYYEEASASYALNVLKASQSIRIIDVSVNGIIKKIGDETFPINVVTSVDKSLLSYFSSNMGVATIDNNGIVTIVGEGETVLTVTVPGDDNYESSSASVILRIQSKDSNNDTTEEIIENIPNTFFNDPFKFLSILFGIIMISAGVVCFIRFRKIPEK